MLPEIKARIIFWIVKVALPWLAPRQFEKTYRLINFGTKFLSKELNVKHSNKFKWIYYWGALKKHEQLTQRFFFFLSKFKIGKQNLLQNTQKSRYIQ